MNKGFKEWFEQENPDILCLQETKIQDGQVDVAFLENLGYYHYWNHAQKKGYSGVAIFSKQKPDLVSMGIGISEIDAEGRLIRADFGDVTLLATYFPSGTMGDVRQTIKMKFLEDFLNFTLNLRKTRSKLIICGDFNICHKPIDINFPKKHETMSGFLPEEREWFDRFVATGFVDSFREFNQEANQYTWWSYRANAKAKNLGWRLDYYLVTEELRSALKNASIQNTINFSDHCPICMELDF